jgi:flagellar P-ring protein precursor FlgI
MAKMAGTLRSQGPRLRAAALVILLLTGCLAPGTVYAVESRIKDLATLEGSAPEPLVGYGLIVGLSGTGDGQNSEFTVSSLAAMLERLGVTVEPARLKPKNVAAVLVTARLEAALAEGSLLDVTVSSLGDAASLEGGFLIMTPLRSADGQVRALAQGSVSIGGFNVRGGSGNSFRKNHATVGMIPGGGRVTAALATAGPRNRRLVWLLNHPDFNSAASVAAAVNGRFGPGTARALDAQRIEVQVPELFRQTPVDFIARMGELPALSDGPAKVVINERTGTIIVGEGVRLSEAAVAHGNLKVVIQTRYDVSQPSSFNESGRTVVTPDVDTRVEDHQAQVLRIPETSTVADVVAVLNELGASPRDIIAILQALAQSGAMQAQLQIM